MSQTKAASIKRLLHLDALRGLMALGMIFAHTDMAYNPTVYGLEGIGGRYEPILSPLDFWLKVVRIPAVSLYFIVSGMLLSLRFESAKRKGESAGAIAGFLAKRGLMLIALDLTLGSLGWYWALPKTYFLPIGGVFGPIACFGLAFVLLSPLLCLPTSILLALSALIPLVQEFQHSPLPTASSWVLKSLFYAFWLPGYTPTTAFMFPAVPWLSVLILGFCIGRLQASRKNGISARQYFGAATLFYILFFALRLTTSFGSLGQPLPRDWAAIFTLSKFPPSIHYFLVAVAGCLVVLGFTEKLRPVAFFCQSAFLRIFGRHPLLVYFSQLYVLALLNWVFDVRNRFGSLACVFATYPVVVALIYLILRVTDGQTVLAPLSGLIALRGSIKEKG